MQSRGLGLLKWICCLWEMKWELRHSTSVFGFYLVSDSVPFFVWYDLWFGFSWLCFALAAHSGRNMYIPPY